jgi:glycosyltransferase involved in cell wall biosynthesis
MSKVYHLLTESEPFSEQSGGAVSRWVANVVRDEADAIVLAPSMDDSWRFAHGRVHAVPGLVAYKGCNDRFGRLLRWPVRARLLRLLLSEPLSLLRKGDTLWVHNRPEFAAAIEPLVHGAGARLVLHLHNSHLIEWPERVHRAIKADHYVFLTRFLQSEAQRHIPNLGPCDVTYSGADTALFHPPAVKRWVRPRVLFVGRLVPEKGVHVLAQAMDCLQKRGVELTATVVGSAAFGNGPATAYMQELQRSAPSNLKFDGYCAGAELGRRFQEADIFCMPSIWQEALGLVVVEAMASGLPVVASRSGGIPEMLAKGGGLLVDRGSVEQLADALELVATNVALRQRLAQEALLSFRKNFTWDVVRGNYHRIVESVQAGGAFAVDPQPNAAIPMPVEAECTTFPTSA